jgi:hypothetical protein
MIRDRDGKFPDLLDVALVVVGVTDRGAGEYVALVPQFV